MACSSVAALVLSSFSSQPTMSSTPAPVENLRRGAISTARGKEVRNLGERAIVLRPSPSSLPCPCCRNGLVWRTGRAGLLRVIDRCRHPRTGRRRRFRGARNGCIRLCARPAAVTADTTAGVRSRSVSLRSVRCCSMTTRSLPAPAPPLLYRRRTFLAFRPRHAPVQGIRVFPVTPRGGRLIYTVDRGVRSPSTGRRLLHVVLLSPFLLLLLLR